jgi:hypothetical protein
MSAFQGFDRRLNLAESLSDRAILNNLGTEPIADDIVKFLNNLRNKSFLEVQSSNITGSVISFVGEREFVFTNGTELRIDNVVRYVGNSNGINQFSIYSDINLTQLIANPPTGLYVRSDAVLFDDVLKLVPFRDVVVEDIAISVFSAENSNDQGFYNSIINVYSDIRGVSDLASYMSRIEGGIDFFNFRKSTTIGNISDFESDNKVLLSGNLIVLDPAGVNDNTISSESGIFILDITTGNATRIFSSNDNVWNDDGTNLVGDTREIVIGNLVLDEGTRLLRKAGSPPITTETQVITTFTHFNTIIVNGEEYQLCLK